MLNIFTEVQWFNREVAEHIMSCSRGVRTDVTVWRLQLASAANFWAETQSASAAATKGRGAARLRGGEGARHREWQS